LTDSEPLDTICRETQIHRGQPHAGSSPALGTKILPTDICLLAPDTHPSDTGLLLFAGLYESRQAKPGEWQMTFTIITRKANGLIEPIHNQMPVILDERGRKIG